MQTSSDFTNCKIDTSANYGGSDKKRGIIYNNSRYMLKLSDVIPDEKRTELNSSYSNSAFSEYISCHILLRIAPRIDMEKICRIVDDTLGISDIRKQFYKTMLNERYQQVIKEPYLQYCREHMRE